MPTGVAAALALFFLFAFILVPPPYHPVEHISAANAQTEGGNQFYWQGWAEAFAAIFTGVLAYFAFVQVSESRTSAEHQLRAYVTIKTITPSPKVDRATGQHLGWMFCVTWQNTGATPANHVKLWINSVFLNADLPNAFDFARPNIPEIDVGPIGPNSVMHTDDAFVPLQQLQNVQNGIGRIYFWGRIDYRDVFEDTPERHTAFRVCIDVIGDVTNIQIGSNPFKYPGGGGGNTNS